jgi:hypothetical protein
LGVVASCTHQSSATGTAAKKHGKPGPEESFQVIMDTFRRRMEETPVGFVVNNPNGRSTMTGTNKVSYEVSAPKSADEKYKAVVTVKSQSRYSVKVSTEAPDDAGHEKGPKNDRLLPDKEKDQKGSESFEPNFAKGASETSKSNSSSTHVTEQVMPHEDVEEHKYDLLYQDGKWILVTELNQETEQAVQNAFKTALETQG